MASMALMMKKLNHLSMTTMPKGSSTSIIRMFVTSSPTPPVQGGTLNQENTMQEMTSDVNPQSHDTSRGIASSTTEHVIETAEEMGDQAKETVQDAWSSAKETAECMAEESKETIKDSAERVKRAMNTKERI